MLIDTHCHLNFQAFKDDLPQVLERARSRGVTKFVIPGTDLASSEHAIQIAQTYSDCWAAVGIHPHHAKDPNIVPDDSLRRELKKLLQQKRVVAAGEIGIDYHEYRKSKYTDVAITDALKEKQRELFVMQWELAAELNLSTILHCRDAHDDMIQTISNISRKRENQNPFSGIFHCWGGSKKNLQLLITMGYYIGFDGNITYSPDWQQFVAATPLSHLLIETDSPYLTPEPHRGTRNEPMYLPLVAETVAKYHGVTVAHVSKQTTQNAEKAFRI